MESVLRLLIHDLYMCRRNLKMTGRQTAQKTYDRGGFGFRLLGVKGSANAFLLDILIKHWMSLDSFKRDLFGPLVTLESTHQDNYTGRPTLLGLAKTWQIVHGRGIFLPLQTRSYVGRKLCVVTGVRFADAVPIVA